MGHAALAGGGGERVEIEWEVAEVDLHSALFAGENGVFGPGPGRAVPDRQALEGETDRAGVDDGAAVPAAEHLPVGVPADQDRRVDAGEPGVELLSRGIGQDRVVVRQRRAVIAADRDAAEIELRGRHERFKERPVLRRELRHGPLDQLAANRPVWLGRHLLRRPLEQEVIGVAAHHREIESGDPVDGAGGIESHRGKIAKAHDAIHLGDCDVIKHRL